MYYYEEAQLTWRNTAKGRIGKHPDGALIYLRDEEKRQAGPGEVAVLPWDDADCWSDGRISTNRVVIVEIA